jgi:polyisoprenyl-teichoic acid--peptidoglycan teichoic acid transferase
MKNFGSKSSFNEPRVNLLSKEDNQYPRGRRIFKISKFIVYLFVVLFLAFIVFSYQVLFTNNSISDVFSGKVNIFKQLNTLAGDGNDLKGQADDRINILLLGMGGAGHDGPYLTDTVMVASFKPSTKELAMVSIPRDLLVEIPGYGWWKINNANAYGENSNPNNGGLLAKEVVQNIFDIPVHYYIRVDFSGFEQMIDTLDGIKIDVETGFTDYQFPTNDYKYQVVSFESGMQTMDGETALDFVRSRHGNNGEGSDFARSQRQQKVIEAVKKRVLSKSFWLSPRKINKLSKDLADHVRTDFQPWEIIQLARMADKIDTSNIETRVLDDSPDGYLYPSLVNEAYVLQPWGDDFSQIQLMVKNIFKNSVAADSPVTTVQSIVKVEIRNGTTIAGLASRNMSELKLAGYRVMQVGNAPVQDYIETEVYKISGRELTDEVNELAAKYKGKVFEKNIPDWIVQMAAPDLDFFIILGQDAEAL